jgi:hypothetical protein
LSLVTSQTLIAVVCRDFSESGNRRPHGRSCARQVASGRPARPLAGAGSVRGALWGLLTRAVALVAVLLLASCGGGGAGGEGDPARLAPADAQFYFEAVVRPEGSLRDDALDAAGKVLVTDDPKARIRELVQRALEDIDYDRDVAPWLGERAAVWVEPSDGAYSPKVVLLAATDTDAARDSLELALDRDDQPQERSYRDRDYVVDASGVAAGIVDDFAVIGPENLYKRTVDAGEGDSLADADEYADAVDALPDERLAQFWAETSGLLEMAVRHDPLLGQLRELGAAAELPPVAGAFLANGERLELEVQVHDTLPFGGTPLLQELPGDSWAAIGAADLGAGLRDAINRFGGALGGVAIRGQLRRETGLDLDRDLLDWMGHAGFFVRGTTPETIDGGLVIQVTDTARATDAFGRIAGALQQAGGAEARPVEIEGAEQAFEIDDRSLPRPLILARSSERVVVTIGTAAAEAAFGSDDRLGDTDLYTEAQDLVGMEPNLLVSMPQLLGLVDRDSDSADARHYLQAYTVVAAGIAEDGTARVAAGLR